MTKNMKSCSVSLVISKMQIKNIVRYHCTEIGIVKIRRLIISNVAFFKKNLDMR